MFSSWWSVNSGRAGVNEETGEDLEQIVDLIHHQKLSTQEPRHITLMLYQLFRVYTSIY